MKALGAISLIGVVLLLTAYACDREHLGALEEDYGYSERLEQMLDFAGQAALSLDNAAGELVIEAWDQQQIQLVATKKAKTQAKLNRITIEIQSNEQEISVRTRSKDGLRIEGVVQYALKVPAAAELILDQGAGVVRIAGMRGSVQLDLGTGDVRVDQLQAASVTMKVGAGHVEVSGFAGQTLVLNVGTGDVRVDAPLGAAFDSVSLEIGTGNLMTQGLWARRLEGHVGTGNLEMTLPADISTQLKAKVGLGDISIKGFSNMQLNQKGFLGAEAQAVLGAGEGAITLEVGMGNISVRPWETPQP